MNNSVIDNSYKFPCIIPTIPKDYLRMHQFYNNLFLFLPISKLIFIGPLELENIILSDIDNHFFDSKNVLFVDENNILSLSSLRPVFNSLITSQNNLKPTAINWYYQQFLKMAYSLYCEDDYYLCWDSDTIPLRKIDMFSTDGKPYLDIKPEYNRNYFVTIERLFGFSKIIEESFISEHMLFNVKLMSEMISDINSSIFVGKNFCEKILNAVGSDNLNQGFSEFETYGTWIGMKHSSTYKLRKWKSFRNTNFFIDIKDVSDNDLAWLSKDYDSATFEKYQETNETLNKLFTDSHYRAKLSPEQFYKSVLESGVFGTFSNNSITEQDFSAPI